MAIAYEGLRVAGGLDAKYRAVHDALTQAYYAGQVFTWKGRDYGPLTQAQFNRLHALIYAKYDVEFHARNQAEGWGYDPAAYDNLYDDRGRVRATKSGNGKTYDDACAAAGITLEV